MEQPAFWAVLAVAGIVAVAVRLVVRRPLWRRRASALPGRDLAVAAVVAAALVFHCAAMFFPDWVDALPLTEQPATAVRDLGPVSQVSYWVPAGVLVVALRRVWSPALALLTAALVGVGYTMFVPHDLEVHLTWIAAAVLTLVAVMTALVTAPSRRARHLGPSADSGH